MSSKDLAESIFRAEKIADLVRQIDSLDFCISKENPGKIYLKDGRDKVDREKPIIDFGELKIPKEMIDEISAENICAILNDSLEEAKFKIIQRAQASVFKGLDPEEPEDDHDGFIPVK